MNVLKRQPEQSEGPHEALKNNFMAATPNIQKPAEV